MVRVQSRALHNLREPKGACSGDGADQDPADVLYVRAMSGLHALTCKPHLQVLGAPRQQRFRLLVPSTE